jgi:biuret amidohydrolase
VPAVFDPERSAVVVVDLVNHQCTPGTGMLGDWERGAVADTAYFVDRLKSSVIPAHQALLPTVRAHGGKVVFLRVGGYDAGYADLTPGFKGIARWEPRADLWGTQVLDDVGALPGDVSLIKTGSGGFYTSALDSHLRNMGVETVIYTGVITNGCVWLTAAGGFDRGYRGLLAADATATLSPRLQATAEVMMDGYIANVVPTESLIALYDKGDTTALSAHHSVQNWAKAFSD